MSLDLASKNRQNKGGTGRGKNTGRDSCRPSILAFGDGFHPKIPKHREMGREGLRKMPAQSQAKTKLVAHPGTSGGLCPALCAVCLLSQRSRLEDKPGKRDVLPSAGRRGGCRGAARELFPIWESPPDLCGARPRLSLGREGGKEPRGFAPGRPV